MKRNFLRVLFLGSLLTGTNSGFCHAADSKFGVADFTSLIERSSYTTDVEKLAKAKRAELEKTAAKLNEQLAEKGQELTKSLKDDGALVSSIELALTQSQFDQEREMTNLNFKGLNQKATLEVQAAKEKSNDRVRGIIKNYAKDNGYTAVLNSSNPEMMLVCNETDDFDLTEKLKKHIEDTYKTDQKKEMLLASVTKSKDQKVLVASDEKKATEVKTAAKA